MTPSEEKAENSKDDTSDAQMVTVFGKQSTGGLGDEERAPKTSEATNIILGEDNEKPQNKEDDDWGLGLRATNEKITRRKQQDVNTETSEGDATNKIINNSAPHRTNEHDSKKHGEVGTREMAV